MEKLNPTDRLVVAADFKGTRKEVFMQVRNLTDAIRETGVHVKVNSALRACGYSLIDAIHQDGLRVFADLKLFDIPETLSTDGELLQEAMPELLTVACSVGRDAMQILKRTLPKTEVLGVTILTHQTDQQCMELYKCIVDVAVNRLAHWALESAIDGIVCSPSEAWSVRNIMGSEKTINTPGVRFANVAVQNDDQNFDRVMTPFNAIGKGADRIVMGRPITQSKDPRGAVMRALDEIASAL